MQAVVLDDEPYVALKAMCDAIGIDIVIPSAASWTSQNGRARS